jgi:hypothetical protein
VEEATGEATAVSPGDSAELPRRDNPPVLRPGATDPTVSWVAPDGTTGPGVAAIFRVFGKSDGLTWALRVAHCESHYDPGAVNGDSGATGLFQFMPSTWNGYFAGWNIWTDQWACK